MSAKPFTFADIPISRFPKANKPDEVEMSTIGAFIKECRSDRWRGVIERIRSAPTEAERRHIKTTELPVYTPSGMFSRRDKTGLESYSGAIIADVDHLRRQGINPEELRDKLAKDPHVVMACISPSGDGVKALVRVFPDAVRHEAHFRQAAEYFKKTYGVEMDPSGKDVCRAFFATHDPDLKVNINARVMPEHGANGSDPDFRAGAQGMDDSEKPYQWALPVPLEEALPDVPPLDTSLIPPEIQPWISDEAERMQCSVDLIFHGAVVMYGSLAGTAVRLRPKEHDNWEVTPNFYGGCVAPPGSMKTPAMEAVFGIVDRLEYKAFEQHANDYKDYEKRKADYDQLSKGLKRKLDRIYAGTFKPAKGEAAPTADAVKAEIDALAEPAAPVLRRYIVHDATIEKLHDIISQNPRGILVSVDELASLISLWEDPNHQKDRKFFLKASDGKSAHTIDRIIRGTVYVPNLCVSIYGGIQPEILADYMSKLSLIKDGMIARFTLLAYPDPHTNWRRIDRPPDIGARERAFNIAQAIADMDFAAMGGERDEHEGRAFPHFRLDYHSQKAFNAWYERLARDKLRSANEPPFILSHLGKYRAIVPKLALIFHLLRIAETGAGDNLVGLEHVERAIALADYYEAHMRRIYGMLTKPSIAGGIILREKLIEKRLADGFTARDVQRKNWPGLRQSQPVDSALQLLVETNHLARVISKAGKGGWPVEIYLVNPQLYTCF